MEQLKYTFGPHATASKLAGSTLVGVVGSGNLEILFEPGLLNGQAQFVVNTSIHGFDKTWQAVLSDFWERHPLANVLVTINDAGATPAVVSLRLAQAMEELSAPGVQSGVRS